MKQSGVTTNPNRARRLRQAGCRVEASHLITGADGKRKPIKEPRKWLWSRQ